MKTGGDSGMKYVSVPVSLGELIDKITILEIKGDHMEESEKRANVLRELSLLRKAWDESGYAQHAIRRHREDLKSVNRVLWDIENQIRRKEAEGNFDQKFIDLARSVYVQNDRRAKIKRRINLELGSELVEEKLYVEY
jgi:hypothetical protein